MLQWLLCGYAIFIAVLLGAAGFVALFGSDSDRRAAGYKVLKLIWVSVTGSTGSAVIVLKLVEIGAIAL